jgi:hypothetical protein
MTFFRSSGVSGTWFFLKVLKSLGPLRIAGDRGLRGDHEEFTVLALELEVGR